MWSRFSNRYRKIKGVFKMNDYDNPDIAFCPICENSEKSDDFSTSALSRGIHSVWSKCDDNDAQ